MPNEVPVTAILLAGGAGSRLRPVVGEHAKALVTVGGRPFLEYQFDMCERLRIARVILAVGLFADEVAGYVAAHPRPGLDIVLVHDAPGRLGTGGSLLRALAFAQGDTLVVLNADTLVWGDWPGFCRAHTQLGAVCTVAVAKRTSVDSAAIILNPDGRVIRYEEKATLNAPWCSGGAYILARHIWTPLPVGSAFSFEREWLPQLVARGSVYSFPMDYYDIGVPERYRDAENAIHAALGE